MTKFFPLILCYLIFISIASGSEKEKIKYRKLTPQDFSKLSVNDTSSAVIDLFFKKKDQAIFNQMSLLPITAVLIAMPPTYFIGVGSAVISVPLFINGSYTLIRFRKKKLYQVLIQYKETGKLPPWVRKKANKILENYEILQINY